MSKPVKVWVTQRYAKDAPEAAVLKMHGEQKWVHFAGGLMAFGYREGEDYHRRYADAVTTARDNRNKWLRELTTKAAEIATLPEIPKEPA